MLGTRPLLGAALVSIELPETAEEPFEEIARGGVDFAVVLELTGFPKSFPPSSGGATPLLGAPLLASIGIAGEEIVNNIAPKQLLLSDTPYRTGPDDSTSPNMWTEARMTRRADIEQTAPVSLGSSRRAQTTTGDLEFADNDGHIHAITDQFSFENRPALLHVVEIGKPWAFRKTLSEAIVESITRSRGSVRINLTDTADVLDTRLVPRVYGGSGLRDGTPELAGTSPPVGWGLCRYAKPLLEDPSIWLYRVSDYSINAVHAVEERGLLFTFAGDEPSYEALRTRASTLAEGEYATCLVDGSLVIKFAGGSPLDPDAIRVTFEGVKFGGSFVSFWGDVMLAMLQGSMGLSDSIIDIASFQSLPQHKISYYFAGGTESPTGSQAFTEIMEAGFGVFGAVNNNRIGVKLFNPPSNQSASAAFVAEEIYSVSEIAPPQKPVWSQAMGWGPNQNPYEQDQLASGLTTSQVEERTRKFEGVYKNEQANILASNAAAVQGAQISGVFDEEAGAKDAVDRIMGVWGVHAKAFEVELSFVAANVQRGSVISMTHTDLSGKSGRKFLVFSKRLQLSRRRVILSVVG